VVVESVVLFTGDKKMTIARVDLKWFQFRQKIINWQNRHRKDQLARVDRARERSISILQNRYGYTREQATSELDKHYSTAWLG
jgi:hypothetical protein